MTFSNKMFSTKISDPTKNGFLLLNDSSSVLLLTDLTISTKMTFFNSTQLKMMKISTVSGTQEVTRK